MNKPHPLLRQLPAALGIAFTMTLAACGGGGDGGTTTAEVAAAAPTMQAAAVVRKAAAKPATATSSSPRVPGYTVTTTSTGDTLQVSATLPGFPHTFDVYRPANAKRVIVFVHGLGGYSWQMAYDLGLNSLTGPPNTGSVDWDWLEQNGVIAIFPQGQIPAGSTQTTWSDYVQNSGADDVGFLKALSSYAKTQFGITDVSLSGHSDGGAMTARMWCEATTSYKAFVSLAGPMPSTTYPLPAPTCTPLAKAPYYAVIGGQDTALAKFVRGTTQPTPNQISVGLTNPILVAEWSRHRDRGAKVCGASVPLTSTSTASYGPSWTACDSQVRYTVVSQADHPIESLEQFMGVRMVDLINGFVQ